MQGPKSVKGLGGPHTLVDLISLGGPETPVHAMKTVLYVMPYLILKIWPVNIFGAVIIYQWGIFRHMNQTFNVFR